MLSCEFEAKFLSINIGSNKMGLSPIPLIHDNNFNAIIESMKIQRQFLHGSFIIKDRVRILR